MLSSPSQVIKRVLPKTAVFERRHYNHLAYHIYSITDKYERRIIAQRLANIFSANQSNFDSERWMSVCTDDKEVT